MRIPHGAGILVILDAGAGVACPDCGRAMAFAIIEQTLACGAAAAAASSWGYRCLACHGGAA